MSHLMNQFIVRFIFYIIFGAFNGISNYTLNNLFLILAI